MKSEILRQIQQSADQIRASESYQRGVLLAATFAAVLTGFAVNSPAQGSSLNPDEQILYIPSVQLFPPDKAVKTSETANPNGRHLYLPELQSPLPDKAAVAQSKTFRVLLPSVQLIYPAK